MKGKGMSKGIGAAFACALCMSLGLAPLFMGTFPLFLQPVSNEFGWGSGIFPQSALTAGVAGALAGPFIGQLIDRFGVRPIMLLSILGWAASLVWLSFLNGSQLQLLIISAVMGIMAAGCGPIALAKVVAGWFDRHRGLALGIVLSAAPAVATAIMIVVTNALLAEHSWQFTYRAFAVVVVCVVVPTVWLLVREATVADAASKPDAEQAAHGLTAAQALRTRDFWKIMLLTGLVCSVAQALVAHFVAFSAEYGVTPTSTTVALSAFSLFGPVGPLLAGVFADRVSGPKPLALFYALPLLGFAALIFLGTAAAVPAMILLGVGFQATTGMLPYLMTRYFGVRYASQLFGIGLGIVTLSMGIGPVILGFARDRAQSFTPATPLMLGLLALALVVSLAMRRYEVTHATASDNPAVARNT
jgi:cyanate permease